MADDNGVVTDFASFYRLDSKVKGIESQESISFAYLYYSVAKDYDIDRHIRLVKDMLILATNLGFDAVECPQVMHYQHQMSRELNFLQSRTANLAWPIFNFRPSVIRAR